MTRHPLESPSRFGVAPGILESSSYDVHPFGPSQAVRDVADVAERARLVALPDVGVEVAPPTIPDRLDEVAEMVLGAALERADEVPVPVEQGRLGDEPSRAVDDMAGAELRAEGVGLPPPAPLPDGGPAEGVDDHLRVGRLPRILVPEPPADAEHRVPQAVEAHQPAADVHDVDVVVPQLAVAGVPVPV